VYNRNITNNKQKENKMFNTIEELSNWYDENVVMGDVESLVGQCVGNELYKECVYNSEWMRNQHPESSIDFGFGLMEEWFMGEGESFTIDESGKIVESSEYF
jgi:hypothetical protein